MQSAAVFDLSDRGKVEVAGADAARFLHNLTTNDILRLQPGDGCEAFLTTAKAKVVARVFVYAAGPGAFWLDADPGLGEVVVKHLDHYLISEQVELADRTLETAQFYLAGPRARSLLDRVSAGLPNLTPLRVTARSVVGAGDCQVRCSDLIGVPRYDVLCAADRAEEVWRALVDAGATPAVFQQWRQGAHGLNLVKCFVCHGSTGSDFRLRPVADRCVGCHADQVSTMREPSMKGKDCFTCHAAHALNPHVTSPQTTAAAAIGADGLAPMITVEGRIPPAPPPAAPGADKDPSTSKPNPPTDR